MRGPLAARAVNQSVPETVDVPVAITDPVQAFEEGALGTLVSGEFVEATSPITTKAQVTHMSKTPYGVPPTTGNHVGFGIIANRREFPPGRALCHPLDGTPHLRMNPSFGGGETFATELPADTGGRYAAVRGADAKWRIDFDTAGPFKYLRTVASVAGNEVSTVGGIDALALEVEVQLVLAESEEES